MKIKIHFLKQTGKNFEEVKETKLGKKTLETQIKAINQTINNLLLRVQSGTYDEIKEKKIELTDLFISYEGKTFIIPQNINTYKTKKDIHLFFDWENEKLLFFKKHDLIYDSKFLDRLLNNQIIGQLILKLRKSMEKPDKLELLKKIAVPVLCLVAGVFIGGYIL